MTAPTHPSLDDILTIIPVQNEASTIAGVIHQLQSIGLSQIRVIDNGSSDRSASIAVSQGAEVIREEVSGYGQACWRGLQNIPEHIRWILFCDGDGSDDLSALPSWFEQREQYDLILGDRSATSQGRKVMTPVQRFGNALATNLIKTGWGHGYQDLGPMRLIRKESLEAIAMSDRGFGWTVEMQVKAIELNLKIAEFPVGYFPRKGGKSKISGTITGSIQAGTIILGTLGKLYWQKSPKSNSKLTATSPVVYAGGLLIILAALWLIPYGDLGKPRIYASFALGMAVMSLGFALSWLGKRVSWWWFWLVAIAARIILLFMHPGNDIWRYLWEGYIQLQGFSPYDYAPNAIELEAIRTGWWWKINHLEISAIYPPLTQLGFRLLAAIDPSVILFKSAFVAADLAICAFLVCMYGYSKSLLYAWHPIIIYSFAGGGHYDSWFVLPLIIALLFLRSEKSKPLYIAIAAFSIGVSIAIKWISLPVLGWLVWHSFRRFGYRLAIAVLLLGIAPFFLSSVTFCATSSCQLVPVSSSFVAYGRYTEFIPFFLGKVWAYSQGNNSLFAIPLGLGAAYLILTQGSYHNFAQSYFVLLLLISPIVHFWYFTWIVPFGVARQNWGIRLLSASSLFYFILPYRQASSSNFLRLTVAETLLLWLPFILGYCYSLTENSELSRSKVTQ